MNSFEGGKIEGFEAPLGMSPTGLYEDFESSFTGLAQAIKAYQDAQDTPAPTSGPLSREEIESLVEQCLAVPALEYKAYLHEKRPEVEETVLRASDAKAVVKIDAAIRTLNMRAQVALRQFQKGIRGETVLAEVVESLKELYAQIGRTDEAL